MLRQYEGPLASMTKGSFSLLEECWQRGSEGEVPGDGETLGDNFKR